MLRVVAAALIIIAGSAAVTEETRVIDPARSHARFGVQHIWVERVTGSVPIVSGTVMLAAGSRIPTAVHAILDAARIETGEPDRDRSLESADFFDVQRYPRWSFTSTRIVPHGDDAFLMDGDLAIHGVTQPERVNVTIGGGAGDPLYHATAQIDRHAFGMTTTRLDPTIGTSVDVTLDIMLR